MTRSVCRSPNTRRAITNNGRRRFLRHTDGTAIARAMNQTAPVSCIPAGKMSKAKKVLDEAREIQNPELDLADKGIATFEEMPGLRESHPRVPARSSSRIAKLGNLSPAAGRSLAFPQHHSLRGIRSRGRVGACARSSGPLNLTLRV